MRRFHMSRIRAYKMTHATGFAPNPFDGYMTLACCKPMIRKKGIINVGDWIVGVGSKTMEANAKDDRQAYDNKIIYAMKVCCLIPWTEYYQKCKELKLLAKIHEQGTTFDKYGDCIYKWREASGDLSFTSKYEQDEFTKYATNFDFIPNIFHGAEQATHDLGGEYVIVGCPKHSYFLGKECVDWAPISNKNIKRSAYGMIISDENPDDLEKVILTKTKVRPISEESPNLIEGRIIKSKDMRDNDYQGIITEKEVLEELNKGKIKRDKDHPVIILSRKGFDTAYGRCPSLIIGKQMISFPIPEDSKQNDCKAFPTYSNLKIVIDNVGEKSLKNLILGSTGRAKKTIFKDMELDKEDNGDNEPRCHFDPQLFNYHNVPDFIASLGQMDIAARLLKKYDVKKGDFFLFFGNFKFVNDKLESVSYEVEGKYGKYEVPKNAFVHCIWGYMEIGKVVANPQHNEKDPYIKEYHPHMKYGSSENYLYIATDTLSDKWCPKGYEGKLKGYGVFDFNNSLVLSPVNDDEFKKQKEYLKGLKEEINDKNFKRNTWTILPLYVNNDLKTQIPVRGQEFILFPNSLPEKESNINSECIENYNKFIEKIKEVIKKQAAKFLIS